MNVLLILWITLPVVVWLVKIAAMKRVQPWLLVAICLLTMIAGYFILLTSVWALDAHLEAEVNKHDLDGDGGISGNELTPAARLAMDEWASDTGRAFAPIVGIPFTAIWYTMLFTILFGAEWVIRSTCFPRKPPKAIEVNQENGQGRNDDRNPYRPTLVD